MQENTAAADVHLSSEEIAQLTAASSRIAI
jgi:hypothetical protein